LSDFYPSGYFTSDDACFTCGALLLVKHQHQSIIVTVQPITIMNALTIYKSDFVCKAPDAIAKTARRFASGFVLFIILVQALPTRAAFQVNPLDGATITPEVLVRNITGNGITLDTAYGFHFGGPYDALGTYLATPDAGFTTFLPRSGIVLSTGGALDFNQPNSADGFSRDGDSGGDSDPDFLFGSLEDFVGSGLTHNAASLRFKFRPTYSRVRITFRFASEEYNEYSFSQFNDVAAIFVNGQDIARPINSVAPMGTSGLIAVNLLNHVHNSQYYINNSPWGSGGVPAVTPSYRMEFDGLTTVISSWVDVVPQSLNTMKIVIADVTDWVWDSAIFIGQGTFISFDTSIMVPAGLTAAYGNGQVSLSWQAAHTPAVDAVDSYTVRRYRTIGGQPEAVFPGLTALSMVDSVVNGVTYYYTVSSQSLEWGPSPESAPVCAAPCASLPTVTVTAVDAQASETSPNTGQFQVTRTGCLGCPLTASYTVGGTGTPNADYDALPGTVTFPSGQSTATITITPRQDSITEGSESVVIAIASGANYLVGNPASATVTIEDDDIPVVSIAGPVASLSEASPRTGTITFSRDRLFGNPLTVYFALGGTAEAGVDYTGIPQGAITIPAGQPSVSLTVTIVDDADYEWGEYFSLTLSANPNYIIGSSSLISVAILENDLPEITITATDPLASESGQDPGTLTLHRSGFAGLHLQVWYTVSGTAANGDDYSTLPNSVSFLSGSDTTTITITPINDQTVEGAETVIVSLSPNPGAYTLGNPSQASIDLEDDDGIPVITHSLNGEFSVTANPSSDGRWRYGYMTTLGGSFTSVTFPHNSPADDGTLVPSWQLEWGRSPAFYHNNSGHTITTGGGAVTCQPGDVWFVPGDDGYPENYGVIRYTVPASEAGTHQILARVQSFYVDWTWTGDTDFHILHNGVEIYGNFLPGGGSAGFTRTLNLAANDTIDFVIGRGADESQYASVLKIWASLQKVAAAGNPNAASSPNNDFALDSNPLPGGRWTLGHSESIGSAFTTVTFADPNSAADDGTLVPCWQPDLWRSPAFYCNTSDHTITAGGGAATFVPRTLWVAAGDDGYPENYGVLRYTVPAGESGLHTIGAVIEAVYLTFNIGDTDFHILKNGQEIEGQEVPAGGAGMLGRTLHLSQGDTVELVVGRGADGIQYASCLKIWAAITRLP